MAEILGDVSFELLHQRVELILPFLLVAGGLEHRLRWLLLLGFGVGTREVLLDLVLNLRGNRVTGSDREIYGLILVRLGVCLLLVFYALLRFLRSCSLVSTFLKLSATS